MHVCDLIKILEKFPKHASLYEVGPPGKMVPFVEGSFEFENRVLKTDPFTTISENDDPGDTVVVIYTS